MDILKSFSIKSLKLNKKRTISTIIGIILSTALICGVATLITSGRETLIQNAIDNKGYYHIKINNISDEQVETINNNRDFKQIGSIYENGFAILEGSKNEYKPYVRVCSMDKSLFETLNFELLAGRFPENSNELIISNHIFKNGKVELNIGQKIKLDVGDRISSNGKILDTHCPYNSYEDTHNPDGTLKEDREDEKLVTNMSREYTIVGIISRPGYKFEPYDCPGYTVITTNTVSDTKTAFFILNKPFKYKEAFKNLFELNSYEEFLFAEPYELKYNYFNINKELLRWEVLDFSDETLDVLYGAGMFVILIIMLTSIFCIRNSFAIMATEKMKTYGMLASVGATKKQIKKNVLFEASILALIGIPLGILGRHCCNMGSIKNS